MAAARMVGGMLGMPRSAIRLSEAIFVAGLDIGLANARAGAATRKRSWPIANTTYLA
jgi:hypothetical protein